MLDYLYHLAVDPFDLVFMSRALWIGILTAISCAIVGAFLIYKNYSIMGIALSNSVLPGIILAAAFAIPLTIGAVITGLLNTVMARYFRKHLKLKDDTIIGLLYTGFLATGIGLTYMVHIEGHSDVVEILFGNILAIEDHSAIELLITNLIVISLVVLLFKSLVLYSFDQIQFRLIGSNYQVMDWVFLILVTLVIISSIQAVGILLTISNLTVPIAAASLLTNRLIKMMVIGVVIGIISLLVSLYISFYLDLATGSLIVVCNLIIFIICYLYYQLKKSLGQRSNQLKTA